MSARTPPGLSVAALPSLLLLGACGLCACGLLPGRVHERPAAPAVLLDVKGALAEDQPTVQVRGTAIRFAEYLLQLKAGQPVRVTLTSDDPRFDPILECRPADGRPNETVRCNNAEGLGWGARLDLTPARDGDWIVYVGDADGRAGPFHLQAERIAERPVFDGHGTVSEAKTGTEPPVSFFCPVVAGRRYRVTVAAKGFPAHLALAAPGVPAQTSNANRLEFTAARSGQAVLQVSSLSLASGPFDLCVTELW